MITHYFRFNRKKWASSSFQTHIQIHKDSRAFICWVRGERRLTTSSAAAQPWFRWQMADLVRGNTQVVLSDSWHLQPAMAALLHVQSQLWLCFYFPAVGPTMHPAWRNLSTGPASACRFLSASLRWLPLSLPSRRHFPIDRSGENIFVNVWTDFPLMIHNFGMQSGRDDNLLYLPSLMKRNCLWG